MARLGIDTNVLVYAHLPALPAHPQVHRFVLDRLRSDSTLVLTSGVLHEFVHVITDERRFTPAASMAEALALARLYLGRPNVEVLGADELCVAHAFDLLERHQLGRRRIADTLFAATLIQNGVEELATCNAADFRVFERLRLIDPRLELPTTGQ